MYVDFLGIEDIDDENCVLLVSSEEECFTLNAAVTLLHQMMTFTNTEELLEVLTETRREVVIKGKCGSCQQ